MCRHSSASAFAHLRESYTWLYGRYGVVPAPKGLVNARLVYLGHADGVMVLYDSPRWATCDIDACRGVAWRVNESDAAIRVEVDPPDGHAPRITDPHPS